MDGRFDLPLRGPCPHVEVRENRDEFRDKHKQVVVLPRGKPPQFLAVWTERVGVDDAHCSVTVQEFTFKFVVILEDERVIRP